MGFLIFTAVFGTIWVESAIGYKILSTTDKKDPQRLLSLLIGRGLTTVVSFIPIVRGLYKFVLGLTSTGAIVRMKYDVYKNRGKQKKSKK
jgi:Fe2+ transport system protein B